MDDSTFDTLTRSFAVPSRRAVFTALGAALFPVLFAQDGNEDALAKPKRGRRRNHGHDADAVQASGKGKKKGKKKKKKKTGGGGQAPPQDDFSGGTPACLAGTCAGCCDAAGNCLAGRDQTACGVGNAPCENCEAQGLWCNPFKGLCTCDPAQCALEEGCCHTQQCIQGRSPDACGNLGGDCEVCLTSEVCGARSDTEIGCCAEQKQVCGRVPIVVLGIIVGHKNVTCCKGAGRCEHDRCCVESGQQGCTQDSDCCHGNRCSEGWCVRDCRIRGCPNPAPYTMKCCQATGECHYDKCEGPLCPGTNMVNCRRTCNIPGQPLGSGQNPPHLDLCPEGTTACCTYDDGCIDCAGGPHNTNQTCPSFAPAQPPVVCPD